MTLSRLLALVLVTICGSAIAVGFYHAWSPPYVTAAPTAKAVPPEPYTFPSVLHTPEETARARLVCAEAGDYGWSVALRRQRTGMTEAEALALLTRERGGSADLRPLARVTSIVYWYDADTDGARPEKTRERVQRVCLKDMLGSLADPKPEPVAQTAPPEKPRKSKGK